MTTAQLLLSAGQPNALDVALTNSPTTKGKLTFVWKNGDLVFDQSAAYPVIMACLAHKGQYRINRNYGTLLSALRRQRSTTGSQMSAYVRDGGAQVEAAGLAQNVTGAATRLSSGRWKLVIRWVANGKDQQKAVTV